MSYAKAKGTKFESDIVKYFTECGFTTVRRVPLSGAAGDKGDIWIGDNPVTPALVLECKNYAKTLTYKQVEDFIQEAHIEYKNAMHWDFVDNYKALLLVKIPNLGTADSWLIFKAKSGITLRCRLGDVVNKNNFVDCKHEEDKISKLINLLRSP